MGMELRISEIRNQKAQRAAHMIDNGDGILKKDELSIFQTKAAELGVSNRVINDILNRINGDEEVLAEKKTTRKEQKAERLAAAKQEVETIASAIKGDDARYTQQVLDETKAKMKEDGKLTKQERQALKGFRKTAVATDAKGVILDAITAQKNTEIEEEYCKYHRAPSRFHQKALPYRAFCAQHRLKSPLPHTQHSPGESL